MRAVSQRAFGGPEVLEIIQTGRPMPGAGEVLVRVRAASINPADWKRRAGLLPRFGPPPFTLGLDLAGTVAAVGGPSRFHPGDAVYGVSLPQGSHAEYVTVAEQSLAPVPANLDLTHAAAVPTAALTAWQALIQVAQVKPGQRVLVHAAAGGIGHLAVQIAKAHGAYVLGTASTAKHDFLEKLGIDEAIDYTSTDFAEAAHDIDAVIDPISGAYGPRSLATLKRTGILVDVRGTGPDRDPIHELAREHGLRYTVFGFTPSGDDLRQISTLIEREALRVIVDRTFPLEQAAEAHRISESGHATGKIVLTLT
ncbi:NADP-dependent oxidoreductase [Dactylosporangium sp. CA-052675]|uniref:NADP-dependent oxidoreductase n=1 Tax=Dactylosporangium sp. CA-052675 TaxID=3239927 RepID=UPI003D9166D6